MKNYVVALLSFFDNEIEQFKIEAENEFNAVKITLVFLCKDDKSREEELEWQNSDEFPKNLEELEIHLMNGDMVFSVIEI